jgi:hypothetical protein
MVYGLSIEMVSLGEILKFIIRKQIWISNGAGASEIKSKA